MSSSNKFPSGCPECGLDSCDRSHIYLQAIPPINIMLECIGMPCPETQPSYMYNKMYMEWYSAGLQGTLKTLHDVIESGQVDIIIGRATSESMNFHLADHWIGPLESMLQGATVDAFIAVVQARRDEFKKVSQFSEIVLSAIRPGMLTPEEITEINQAVPLHFTAAMIDTLFDKASMEQIKTISEFFPLKVTRKHLEIIGSRAVCDHYAV